MKITKYLHSCLLLEQEGTYILVDPGEYTYASALLPVESLKQLDYIVITHSHADHFSMPFVLELVAKFPSVKIISTSEVATILLEKSIPVSTKSDDLVIVSLLPHERLFDKNIPENIQVNIAGILSHPGDSFRSIKTNKVFALPMQGPWGSLVQAMNLAITLKPQYIIPIHDWHWKDEFKKDMYLRCAGFLAHYGITFFALEDGKEITIQ